MVMKGPKNLAPHTIKHDVFDENDFIILVLNFKICGCLQSNSLLFIEKCIKYSQLLKLYLTQY